MTIMPAQVWFNLGCAQQTRGGLDAAERSFGRAFRSCPAATTATDAALRQEGGWEEIPMDMDGNQWMLQFLFWKPKAYWT